MGRHPLAFDQPTGRGTGPGRVFDRNDLDPREGRVPLALEVSGQTVNRVTKGTSEGRHRSDRRPNHPVGQMARSAYSTAPLPPVGSASFHVQLRRVVKPRGGCDNTRPTPSDKGPGTHLVVGTWIVTAGASGDGGYPSTEHVATSKGMNPFVPA